MTKAQQKPFRGAHGLMQVRALPEWSCLKVAFQMGQSYLVSLRFNFEILSVLMAFNCLYEIHSSASLRRRCHVKSIPLHSKLSLGVLSQSLGRTPGWEQN